MTFTHWTSGPSVPRLPGSSFAPARDAADGHHRSGFRHRRHAAVATCLAVLCAVAPASAQSNAAAEPLRRLEVAIGAGLFGGTSVGDVDADLRANDLSPRAYRLFSTETSVASAGALEVNVAVALTRRYAIEARVAIAHPELRTSIADDVEGALPLTVAETFDQYQIGGALIVLLPEWRMGRVLPFVSAGAGYLRELHEGRMLVEEGRVFHAGGGVKYPLFARANGIVRGAGLRADARLYLMSGAIGVDDGPRAQGALSGSLFVTF